MKRILTLLVLTLLIIRISAVEVVRVNQLGYLPKSLKVAVSLSNRNVEISEFRVIDTHTSQIVFRGKPQKTNAKNWGMETAVRLNFTDLEQPGEYLVEYNNSRSPVFKIDYDVYDGTADFLLNYLRQQRCGYNPYLADSCHIHDGIIVDHPTRSGEKIDVTGGWHDASDYLQYSTTSVNTLFQMMFAYQNYPSVFQDEYDSRGEKGSNKTPDILDEIKWGLDWMLKMNPSPGEMYNQIADDRDHAGFRLPNKDSADYGLGEYRPVYFVTGKPQGLAEFKNQSTGVSSIAGKFASAFALGSQIFELDEPEYAELLKQKALDAWNFALSDTGFCQTACNVSPYFYEERNFTDDLELAAAQLFELTGDLNFLKEANYWGEQEAVSPWIKNGTARHYESYPFINLGHFYQLKNGQTNFAANYNAGLQLLYDRGKDDPFFNGLPFIWCSNNLLAGALTQAHLYATTTGDSTFTEMEAALRDWLFGCNPWGTAMICGLPEVSDSPESPHSSYTVLLNENTYGGLVDGPVYTSIYKSLIGITLTEDDEYESFNNGKAVYHDDIGDYSTNEPTMDGTASLSYIFAALEAEGKFQKKNETAIRDRYGAIIRLNPAEPCVYLAFTADSFFEGGEHVLHVLEKNGIKASFFFTGNFLRNEQYKSEIEKVVAEGHYVGVHSDRHLLYAPWEDRDSTLVSKSEFINDLKNNFVELAKFGVEQNAAGYFIPPYEWYNKAIVEWSLELGLALVNFTPGTGTNADYTTPSMSNYKSAKQILEHLKKFEETEGLNGAILLIHPGTSAERTDKFYFQLDELIGYLKSKHYTFCAIGN